MLVNGQYPGPKIEGNWGDWFEITVHNRLSNGNGTSIHWHGIHNKGTNHMDGVTGVTQCPIPVGKSMTYKWRATQYGTSWYHSHFGLQYTDGVSGPIVIHGPTSANYDEEYTLMLSDWFHTSAFTLFYQEVFNVSFPPLPPSKLLNGKWKFPCDETKDNRCKPEKGKYEEIKFKKGKKYKLRLINPSTTFMQTVWLDGHDLLVVAMDFVPITPYKTKFINLAVGQRYDVIVEANADTSHQTDFWINMKACFLLPGQTCSPEDSRTGVIRYDRRSKKLPPASDNCPDVKMCSDEPAEFLKPIIKRDVPPPPGLETLEDFFVSLDSWPDPNVPFPMSLGHKWNMANETFKVNWEMPTYTFLGLESGHPEPFPESYQSVFLDQPNKWVYFVIHANFTQMHPGKFPVPLDHPIHLHGHDFVVLAQEHMADFSKTKVKLNLENPVRRDTAVLPGTGFMVIAFKTTNPGAWLLHCHIAFHASSGFALQFVERQSEILPQLTGRQAKKYTKQCKEWREDWEENPARFHLLDSGA
ncbi:Laccase-2 [Dactylella cylindrospora]|nr:Laccase-2 [Dactylella cylindrospora]